jgi:hypothetical protein
LRQLILAADLGIVLARDLPVLDGALDTGT